MAPKDEKPANQEQPEKSSSSKSKKTDNLTPEESAVAHLKKAIGFWINLKRRS